MKKYIYIITCILLLGLLVYWIGVEHIQYTKVRLQENLPHRMIFESEASQVLRRDVTYDKDNLYKVSEEITLRNGNSVFVNYGAFGVLKETVEFYPKTDGGKKPVLRRKSSFNGGGQLPVLVTEDSIYRKDGTLSLRSKLVNKQPPYLYEKLFYYPDGVSLKRKLTLDSVENNWSIKEDQVLYPAGKIASRAVRTSGKGYERIVYSDKESILKKQFWAPGYLIVKTWLFENDGNIPSHLVTESAKQRSIIFYDSNGTIDHAIDLVDGFESVTVYDGEGRALFRQMWSAKVKDGKLTRNILKVETIRNIKDSIRRRIFFFEGSTTPQIIVDESERKKEGYQRRTRTYDEDGWLIMDQTINELDEVIADPKVSRNTIKYPAIPPKFLQLKPYKLPAMQLQDQWWLESGLEKE